MSESREENVEDGLLGSVEMLKSEDPEGAMMKRRDGRAM